jgi:dipeptidyl aminopeptidase/acylaminoacyl peptidase
MAHQIFSFRRAYFVLDCKTLQGSLDPIVPPDQAENMIKVIAEQGGHAEYTLFEGESHGWRKAETIAKALDLELDFYQRTLHLLAW